MRLVGGVSSSVCGFDPVQSLVLLPHEGRDDQREQDYKRHHDDQLKQRVHTANLSVVWGFGRAFGSIPPAFGQLTGNDAVGAENCDAPPTQESAGENSSKTPALPRLHAETHWTVMATSVPTDPSRGFLAE